MSRSRDIIRKIPAPKQLEAEFMFIRETTLRANIAIAMRFVMFQIILVEEEQILGSVRYSMYKNVLLHLASISEAATHHCVQTLVEQGKLNAAEIFDERWVDKGEPKTIYTISDNEKVCASVRERTYDGFRNSAQTLQINRAAFRGKVFNQAVHEKAEVLRKCRNRIHLAGLDEVDDYYSKSEILQAIRSTHAVLTAIDLAMTVVT